MGGADRSGHLMGWELRRRWELRGAGDARSREYRGAGDTSSYECRGAGDARSQECPPASRRDDTLKIQTDFEQLSCEADKL